MSQRTICTDLLGIQGWEVEPEGVLIEEEAVVVRVRRRSQGGYVCSGCGQGLLFAYDHYRARRVRDFPPWGRRCLLDLRAARVDCPDFGANAEIAG